MQKKQKSDKNFISIAFFSLFCKFIHSNHNYFVMLIPHSNAHTDSVSVPYHFKLDPAHREIAVAILHTLYCS